jgi:hypothetical protein
VGREVFERIFDPDFAVIKVSAANRIIAHQEAPSHRPIVNMDDVDFAGVNDFGS